MNFGEGLKRITNTIFWLWFGLGVLWVIAKIISKLIGNKVDIYEFFFLTIFLIILPLVFKKIMFYIIEGFSSSNK